MRHTYTAGLKGALSSAVIWATGAVCTMVLFVVMLLVTAVTLPWDTLRRRQHALCFRWSDAVIAANPYWNVVVHGLEHIEHDRPYVIVANHQSFADIVLLFQTRMQFKWIAKDSLRVSGGLGLDRQGRFRDVLSGRHAQRIR